MGTAQRRFHHSQGPESLSGFAWMYLARHGETESNRCRRYAGRNGEGLTSQGRSQILALAGALARENIESIWTSPVVRAVESAALLSGELKIPVKEDPRLAEMLLGPWEGLTEDEVERTYPLEYVLWNTMPDHLDIDGRDTLGVLASRVMSVVEEATRQARPVLLMTHVAPIRVAVLRVLALDLNWYKRISIPNASCLIADRGCAEVYRVPNRTRVRAELGLEERSTGVEP